MREAHGPITRGGVDPGSDLRADVFRKESEMKHNKRYFLLVLASALLVTLAASTASAGPMPVPKATGSIGMANPMQFASFNAFDYGLTGDRGTVSYANFDYPAPGSGAWDVRGTWEITFERGGTFLHTVTIDPLVPTSTTSSKFAGTGYFNLDPVNFPVDIHGKVKGSDIWFTFAYTGAGSDLVAYGTGTIAPDGSMSGIAYDTVDPTPLTWSVPAGAAHEVLSYTAPVSCAVAVDDTTFRFGFTIPEGFPGLTGLEIVVKVHDGGTPGTNGDTWGHGVGTNCVGGTTDYAITSGNLVVH